MLKERLFLDKHSVQYRKAKEIVKMSGCPENCTNIVNDQFVFKEGSSGDLTQMMKTVFI